MVQRNCLKPVKSRLLRSKASSDVKRKKGMILITYINKNKNNNPKQPTASVTGAKMAQGSSWRSTKVTSLHRPLNLAWLEVVSHLTASPEGDRSKDDLLLMKMGRLSDQFVQMSAHYVPSQARRNRQPSLIGTIN